ncbi:MAG: diacylglycerol kinase [Thermoleophilia bacterium]
MVHDVGVRGIVYAFRTQRNMRVHAVATATAVILALTLNVTRLELLAIVVASSLVIIAEMFNTAIEAAVDAVVTEYHPLVKVAKDVAAGAVLVAATNASIVAYLVFYEALTDPRRTVVDGVRDTPVPLVLGAMILTIVASVAVKSVTGRGTALRGGWPSGHAAAAFSAWAAISIIAEPLRHATLISMLAFFMAMLVAQSRVEGGIHSGMETIAGAVFGTCITILVFQVWG